jgi:hypothetical protein
VEFVVEVLVVAVFSSDMSAGIGINRLMGRFSITQVITAVNCKLYGVLACCNTNNYVIGT